MESFLRVVWRSRASPRIEDIIIQTPQQMKERLAMGDPFLLEITDRGKVLYEQSRG
jgi:hypothetical protein